MASFERSSTLASLEASVATLRPTGDETASAAVHAGLDDTELTLVFERYGVLIVRWAERIFRDGATADDVLHEVMLRLLRRGASFIALETEAQKRAWLYSTTLRICWDIKASRKRERGKLDAAMAFSEAAETPPLEQRQLLEQLWRRLDIEDRIVAVLFFEEGYSKLEIHGLMSRSRPYIDKKLDRIARELQRIQRRSS